MDLLHQVTLPALIGLLGAVCFLVGVFGQVSTKWGQVGPLTTPIRWIAAVAGLVFMLAGFYVYEHQPSQSVQNAQTTPQQQAPTSPVPPAPRTADPEALVQTIKDKQRENISDSTGTEDYQGFTEVKLAEFKKAGVPAQVTAELKGDANFIDLVLAIKAMPPSARQSLLARAAHTYRQPWSQLNLDPSSAPKTDLLRGQTRAGSEAEREIAQSIVALVKNLSQRSEDELRKLYP